MKATNDEKARLIRDGRSRLVAGLASAVGGLTNLASACIRAFTDLT